MTSSKFPRSSAKITGNDTKRIKLKKARFIAEISVRCLAVQKKNVIPNEATRVKKRRLFGASLSKFRMIYRNGK
jgi:hypothetical protein